LTGWTMETVHGSHLISGISTNTNICVPDARVCMFVLTRKLRMADDVKLFMDAPGIMGVTLETKEFY
jgi:hypothetical protein